MEKIPETKTYQIHVKPHKQSLNWHSFSGFEILIICTLITHLSIGVFLQLLYTLKTETESLPSLKLPLITYTGV